MNSSLIITLSFMGLALLLGVMAARGKQMDMEQWSVGGRSFGPILVFILLAGEIFTTFTFLGASGFTYEAGIPAIYAFNVFYFIFAYWFLPPVWKYARDHDIKSEAEFFEHMYDSKAMGVLVSVVAVVAVIPYMAMQFKGLGVIVSASSYDSISSTTAVVIGVIVVTVYIIVSGIHGSTWVAFVKDILILAVMAFMGLYLPYHHFGGFEPMFQALVDTGHTEILFQSSGYSISWFVTTTILLAFSFYMMPHMQNSVYTSKNAKSIRLSAAIMPVYQLIIVFSLFIGFAAIMVVPGLEDSDLALFGIAKATFPPWFVGVIGAAGALAALVPSSLVLMTTATIIANSIYKPLINPNITDAGLMRLSRILVPVIALLALYYTLANAYLIGLIYIMAYSIVAQLFPAMLFGLFRVNLFTKAGAFSGIIVGVVLVVLVTMLGVNLGTLLPALPQAIKDIEMGLIIVFVNIIVGLAVSAVTRRTPQVAANISGAV